MDKMLLGGAQMIPLMRHGGTTLLKVQEFYFLVA